jgi:uncharacterized protein YjbJ (UPF0337 family)
MMNNDRIEGMVTEHMGKAEKGVGDIIGDKKMQGDGIVDQVKGTAQNLYGSTKDSVKSALENAPPSVRDGAYRAVDTVRANPVATALLAGAIGAAIAMLFRSDNSSDQYR